MVARRSAPIEFNWLAFEHLRSPVIEETPSRVREPDAWELIITLPLYVEQLESRAASSLVVTVYSPSHNNIVEPATSASNTQRQGTGRGDTAMRNVVEASSNFPNSVLPNASDSFAEHLVSKEAETNTRPKKVKTVVRSAQRAGFLRTQVSITRSARRW